MLVVHGTRAFRDRVPGHAAAPDDVSTTLLGSWYATLLRWRRPVALLVNEKTLLPLLMPLTPTRTLLERIPDAVAELLAAHQLPTPFAETERAAMAEVLLAPTTNRSVVGVLNEFTSLPFSPTSTEPTRTVCSSCPCGSRRHRSARYTGATSARIASSPCWSPSIRRADNKAAAAPRAFRSGRYRRMSRGVRRKSPD